MFSCRTCLLVLIPGVLVLGAIAACQPKPTPPPPTPTPIPAPRPVAIDKELMIIDRSVVESPLATGKDGPWTFGRLFRDFAPSDEQAKDMLLAWLRSWEQDQQVNGDSARSRSTVRETIINPWKHRDHPNAPSLVSDEAWQVDWNHAPLRLLAIVNRIDLRRIEQGVPKNAGEGRFVFCVHTNTGAEPSTGIDNGGAPLPFTVILEFQQRATTQQEVLDWARRWHKLGDHPFGDDYNAALLGVTNLFAARGAGPGRPNGNALNQLRTNEIALADPWELREFELTENPPRLRPATVKQTLRNSLNGTAELTQFVNEHEQDLRDGTLLIDPDTIGRGTLGAASKLPFKFVWDAPGIRNPEARHGLGFQACNGCHHRETAIDTELGKIDKVGAGFVHVSPRAKGELTQLSGFLTGVKAPDPIVPANIHPFNDLESRARGPRGMEVLLGIRRGPSLEAVRAARTQETRQVRVH